MANWAIVIGIDQYWMPSACLEGAVRDALSMREWLLDDKGGAVPPRNLLLLLSPTDIHRELARSVHVDGDGKKNSITDAIDLVINRSGGEGERFFFHFSGHGFSSWVSLKEENALVAADFTDRHTASSLALSSLFEFFQTTQFSEQFFFIDACRNIPWDEDVAVGVIDRPRKRNPLLKPVQQFIYFATSPGQKAKGSDEGGAFTQVLLEGLRGHGAAKAWDPRAREYVVRWDNLFNYIAAEVEKKKPKVANGATGPLFQTPRKSGEQGGGDTNPILARFAGNAFEDVTLELSLEPVEAAAEANVTVSDYGNIDLVTPFTSVPLSLPLPPREYSVQASALNYEPPPDNKRSLVELYGLEKLTLKMVPKQTPAPAPPHPSTVRLPTSGGSFVIIGENDVPSSPSLYEAARILLEKAEPTHLTVRSRDPLAALEVADSTGKIVATGLGQLTCSKLHPGFYRARWRTPGEQLVEESFDLTSGESKEIQLDRKETSQPLQLLQNLMDPASFQASNDKFFAMLKTAERGVSERLSGMLDAAGSPAARARDLGGRLGRWGLQLYEKYSPFYEKSHFQMLFQVAPRYGNDIASNMEAAQFRIWPFGQPVSECSKPREHRTPPGRLAELVASLDPGPHWFALQLPEQKPVVLPLMMLSGRRTVLVYHQEPDGKTLIFQYLTSLEIDEAQFREVSRRMDLVQRFYLDGLLDNAYQTLDPESDEPVERCLEGFLLVKLGKTKELKVTARNMVKEFGQLSDSHVLMAACEGMLGNEEAAQEEYRCALDQGLPIVDDGLLRLYDAVEEYKFDHSRRELLKRVVSNRISGVLWSAWTPGELSPGMLLEE